MIGAMKLKTPTDFQGATIDELKEYATVSLNYAVSNCVDSKIPFVYAPAVLISAAGVNIAKYRAWEDGYEQARALKSIRRTAKRTRSTVSILIQEVWAVTRTGESAQKAYLANNLRASQCSDRTDSLICILEVKGRLTLTLTVDLTRNEKLGIVTGYSNPRFAEGKFYNSLSIVNYKHPKQSTAH